MINSNNDFGEDPWKILLFSARTNDYGYPEEKYRTTKGKMVGFY